MGGCLFLSQCLRKLVQGSAGSVSSACTMVLPVPATCPTSCACLAPGIGLSLRSLSRRGAGGLWGLVAVPATPPLPVPFFPLAMQSWARDNTIGCSCWQGQGLAGWQEAGGQDGWHPIWVAEMELSWVTGGWWHFSGKGPIQPRQLLTRMVTVPHLSRTQHSPFSALEGSGGL